MSLLMNHLSQLVMLTGKLKELLLMSRIKDNVDLAGLSQQLVVLKDSIG
jgi:hypothetical protein